jgi:hypothetical protein
MEIIISFDLLLSLPRESALAANCWPCSGRGCTHPRFRPRPRRELPACDEFGLVVENRSVFLLDELMDLLTSRLLPVSCPQIDRENGMSAAETTLLLYRPARAKWPPFSARLKHSSDNTDNVPAYVSSVIGAPVKVLSLE